MAYTLDEISRIPTQDDVLEQEVIPELRTRKVRVTDWVPGGVYRAIAYLVALLRLDTKKVVAAIGAGGLPDYAFGLVTPPNDVGALDVTGWCDTVGEGFYGEKRIDATHTKRKLTLTNAVATPYVVGAGAITVLFTATGNRYILDEAITIPASGSVQAIFRSEFASDSANGLQYNDPSGAAIQLVTGNYPGVTATNPATSYSAVAQSGAGLGTVTPSGTPSGEHTVAVRIDVSGDVAGSTVQWSTSLDGGEFVARSGSSASIGSGITVTLADVGGSPAFVVDTVYYFSTPGSDITQVGRDIETPQEYGTRCKALMPALAVAYDDAGNAVPGSPTASLYELLAKKGSLQVKVAFVVAGAVNNEVRIYVAGQGSLLDPAVVAAVNSFVRSLPMMTDKPVVLSPTSGVITLSGATVTVKSAYRVSAQQEINRALALYFAGLDPNNKISTVNPRVDHAYIASIIRRAAGVTKLADTALTINGVAGDLQMPITPGAYEVPKWTQDIATALTWNTE